MLLVVVTTFVVVLLSGGRSLDASQTFNEGTPLGRSETGGGIPSFSGEETGQVLSVTSESGGGVVLAQGDISSDTVLQTIEGLSQGTERSETVLVSVGVDHSNNTGELRASTGGSTNGFVRSVSQDGFQSTESGDIGVGSVVGVVGGTVRVGGETGGVVQIVLHLSLLESGHLVKHGETTTGVDPSVLITGSFVQGGSTNGNNIRGSSRILSVEFSAGRGVQHGSDITRGG
mmetsp:Transcript_9055/g.9820  ORF Transcript_9055/g.9820 Transcript_9055/m.9820 type:complete len:231 (-) Transcript_9055:89-781(-)